MPYWVARASEPTGFETSGDLCVPIGIPLFLCVLLQARGPATSRFPAGAFRQRSSCFHISIAAKLQFSIAPKLQSILCIQGLSLTFTGLRHSVSLNLSMK